jgi:DNA-binding XRE family transcriptional regulator
MSTLANTLKSEISRLARKEIKQELTAMRKAVTQQKAELTVLKKQLKAAESELRSLKRSKTAAPLSAAEPTAETAVAVSGRVPFGPQKLAAKRAQLGLTQVQMAQILDTSTLSYFKWENGRVQPRHGQLVKIAEVLRLGKREAMARLAA